MVTFLMYLTESQKNKVTLGFLQTSLKRILPSRCQQADCTVRAEFAADVHGF
jgi:hypothetical protein